MANAIVSPLGQANGAGASDALFLKVATGEIITAFAQTSQFVDKHQVRTIANGKSASFYATGRSGNAAYHTPGAEVLGGTIPVNEVVITIDDLLLTSTFIANIEEAKLHVDVRGEFTKQMGEELAQAFDRNVAINGVLAARQGARVTGLPGGGKLVNANYLTDSQAFADAHFDAAGILDDKFIPATERYSYMKPAQYYALVKNTKVINKDWGGEGSYANGNVAMIAEILPVKTANLPNTNITTGKYLGDFSKTAGLITHRSAVGTVKLMDLKAESEYQIARQGTLFVAKYAMGHGVVRSEAAIELATA
ncbi:capsid protein [Rhizobium rhizogenes]|uniref:capsid protein n=1 Tax=Rhizobium rhizogenes TaxID=359 RepID=UPI00157444E6|nr:capsid protein [Rhizobium rhizogenes]NTH18451.1 capsid protein [Rhizobium rhizogenes]NTH31425.1 capsid protein [Rhizobium rhizogenes]